MTNVAEVASAWGGLGVWGIIGVFALTALRIWPAVKKLQMEADGSLRSDLMARIKDLEMQLANDRLAFANALAGERLAFAKEMAEERKRCEEEVRELKEVVAGLHAMIRQNSQSGAYLLSDPAGTKKTQDNRHNRGEKP